MITDVKEVLKEQFGFLPKEISVTLKDGVKVFKITENKNDIPNGYMDYLHTERNISLWKNRGYNIEVK